MQIVIDISKEVYDHVLKAKSTPDVLGIDIVNVINAVKNGTPLPEGHGRLIDDNYLLNILRCEEYETCTWRNCSECNREKCIKKRHIVNAPTILKADKKYEVEVINRGNCMKCGKELTDGLFFCKECEDKVSSRSEDKECR